MSDFKVRFKKKKNMHWWIINNNISSHGKIQKKRSNDVCHTIKLNDKNIASHPT